MGLLLSSKAGRDLWFCTPSQCSLSGLAHRYPSWIKWYHGILKVTRIKDTAGLFLGWIPAVGRMEGMRGPYRGGPFYLLFFENEKEQASSRQGLVQCNSCKAVKSHVLQPQLHALRQNKQWEDLFNIYSQAFSFSLLISSEKNMSHSSLYTLQELIPHWKLRATSPLLADVTCRHKCSFRLFERPTVDGGALPFGALLHF